MKKVLIAAPVRQKENIFKEYIKSLDALTTTSFTTIDRCFVLHNESAALKKFCKHTDIIFEYKSNNYFVADDITHRWTTHNIDDIIAMKNHIVDYALKNDYDYIFWVDSDLILQPQTLEHLLSLDEAIVAEVFWTKWKPDMRPLPNCWNTGQETIYEGELEKWEKPGVYEVGGTGACILVHTNVYEDIHYGYTKLHNVGYWGEDRHFCIRAVAQGYEIMLDTTYPAKHLYRGSDLIDTNTVEYWDTRHSNCGVNDWGEKGKIQTTDYAFLMLDKISNTSFHTEYTMLDYGCAQGELCNIFGEKITGFDISSQAITKARQSYPNLEFISQLEENRKWDVVICSNTLEHFVDWKSKLKEFTNLANKYIFLLVPYREGIAQEHFSEFDENSFDNKVNKFTKIQQEVILDMTNLAMNGKQMFVAYEKKEPVLAMGMIVHNEADKYLIEVLNNNLKFCENIYVLDDHSNDSTVAICESFGERVHVRNAEKNWAIEWELRNELLEIMLEESNADWFIFMDADDMLEETFVEDSKELMSSDGDVVMIYIADCWDSTDTFRNDKYFKTYHSPRMLRVSALENGYEWQKTTKHCGSIPISAFDKAKKVLAKSVNRHYGWMTEQDRLDKLKRIQKDDPDFQIWGKEIRQAIIDGPEKVYKF